MFVAPRPATIHRPFDTPYVAPQLNASQPHLLMKTRSLEHGSCSCSFEQQLFNRRLAAICILGYMYQLLKNSCHANKVAKARQIIFRCMNYKLKTSPKNKRSQQNIDAVAWFWWLGIWIKLMFSWSEEECTNKRRCTTVQVHYSC